MRATRAVLGFTLVACILACSLLARPATAADSREGIRPKSIDLFLEPGEAATVQVTVTTGDSVPKADILFLFDVTGSMSGELEEAKENGKQIAMSLRESVADSVFGVASFCDYPAFYEYPGYADTYGSSGDYPWRVEASRGGHFSADIDAVSANIGVLDVHSGDDGPEDYTRALYETMFLDWRTGTKKIVVLFGDSVPHDLDFGGRNTGGDPGRDAVAMTEDDLNFETTVRNLREAGVHVLAVNCGGSSAAEEALRYVASQTGGEYRQLGDPSDLASAVNAMLDRAVSTIDKLDVSATPSKYSSWVEASPLTEGSDLNVAPNTSVEFSVRIAVPDQKSLLGTHHSFTLNAVADGAVLDASVVNVTVQRAEACTAFDPGRHGYSFKNRSGRGSDWANMEQYFGRPYVLASDGRTRLWAAERFFDMKWSDSGAKCFGMSASALALFMGEADDRIPKPAGDLPDPTTSKWVGPGFWRTDESDIEGLLVDFIADYQARWHDVRVTGDCASDCSDEPRHVFEQAVSYIDHGIPVMLCAWGPKRDTSGKITQTGHAVVAYGYKRNVSDHAIELEVWDCNYPGDYPRKVWLISDEYNEWSSDLNFGAGNWGSNNDSIFAVLPVSTVALPGVPPWNPAHSIETHHEDSSALLLGEWKKLDVEAPGAVYLPPFTSSSDESISCGDYVIPDVSADTTILVEGTAAEREAIDLLLLAPGASASVSGFTSGDASLTVTPRGSVIVQSSGDSEEYAYSASRESTGVSEVFEFTRLRVEPGGLDAVNPANDFSFVELENHGAESTFDAAVHYRGPESLTYRLANTTAADSDRCIVQAGDWESLDESAPVMLIDRGGDGSIDETRTFVLATGNVYRGGNDDSWLWWLTVLPIAGLVGLAIAQARNKQWGQHSGGPESQRPTSNVELTLTDGNTIRLSVALPAHITIGRSRQSNIRLSDPKVSRLHALVEVDQDGLVTITDLKSTHGTIVNGMLIAESTRLSAGDTVRLGDTEMIWRGLT